MWMHSCALIEPSSVQKVAPERGETYLRRLGLPLRNTTAPTAKDVIDCDGTSAKKDEGEGQGGSCQREFITGAIGGSDESVVQVYLPDGHNQVSAYKKSGDSGKESCEEQETPEELGERGDIAQPCRQADSGNDLSVVVQASKDLVIAVGH